MPAFSFLQVLRVLGWLLLAYWALALVGADRAARPVAASRGAPAESRSVTIPATLDRLEGDVAVLYWGDAAADKVDIPMKYLPRDCPAGTRLQVILSVDEAETRRLRKRIQELQRQLRR